MGLSLNMNVMNQVVKGVSIYEEMEPVESVCLVLKGRILVHRDGMQTILGTGNFLGICDLYSGKNSVSYTAVDNAVVYPFPVKEPEDVRNIIQSNKEYGGLMVASLSRYIRELNGIVTALLNETDELYAFLRDYYERYKEQAKAVSFNVNPFNELESLAVYEKSEVLDLHKAEYYSECASIAVDVQKAFYQTEMICLYHIEEQTELARQLILEASEITDYLYVNFKKLYDVGETCLFKQIARLIIELNAKNINPSRELLDLIDRMVEKINTIDLLFEKKAGKNLGIDRDELENLYYIIISGEVPAEIAFNVKQKVASLQNSMDIIFSIGMIEGAVKEDFIALLERYKKMSDKTATDDASRTLRKELTSLYYTIYKAVFLNSYNKKECPLSVDLFLKYGFLDETLMREDQLEELVELDEEQSRGRCAVYNLKQWLTLIYIGKKLPSKSEFDLDFEEFIRSQRKGNILTDEEAIKCLNDPMARLDYEIHNMFQYNNRLINGQILTFVPFLQESSFITGMKKALVTSSRVNEAIENLNKIDYSVFYREELYDNPEQNVRKEYIVKEVFPDIILFPISGENAIMWQDLSGRKRDSKGRFLLPSFTVKKLEDLFIKVFGRYHWELCRTMQGSAWNNIKYKSLTSEYMDYIQFYRKNRELSEERKEKLKAQIQKSRNNSREVFVIDYEAWIRNESQGAIRLNRVTREILATYCPLEKDIREKLKNQPMFVEAMNRYYKEKAIKNKNLEFSIRAIEKSGNNVPEEILKTLEYYKDA
ncbi:MAG: hypothetical protein ACERKN_04295 [Velocimicrobium sp.]